MKKVYILTVFVLLLLVFALGSADATIRIRKYPRPYLNLTLTSGGSLTVDTNYYFSGLFTGGIGTFRDGGILGPMGYKNNITTNSTHKTVNVMWFVNGTIDEVTDFGGGWINITSIDHGLDDGDVVYIRGTSDYDSEETVYWVDYDHFRVQDTYVSNQTGTWYDNNSLGEPNNAVGFQLYVDDSDIQYANGSWVMGDFWSHRYYYNGYTSNNIAYSSILTERNIYRYHPEFPVVNFGLQDYLPSGFSTLSGRMEIEFSSDATAYTLWDICEELKKAHVENASSCTNYSLTFLGNLRSPSGTSYLTLQYVTINLIGGRFDDIGKAWTVEDSQIYLGPLRRGTTRGNFIRTALLGRMELGTDGCDFTDSFVNSRNIINYLNSVASSKSNLTFIATQGYPHIWTVYAINGSYWKNIVHIKQPLFAMGQKGNFDDEYPNNVYEDLTFTNIDETYDIYVYQYQSGVYSKKVSFYNTVSDRIGGINLKLYNQNATDYVYVPFYYKLKLKFVDENGDPISGVQVNVTDSQGTSYIWTTDANGQTNEWLKSFEFKSVLAGIIQSQTPTTTYYPFDMVATKANYETYTHSDFNITKAESWEIALESRDWNYSQNLAWKILNATGTTILKLSSDGNLAIAGKLYEDTNTAPPNVIYKIANVLWLTRTGNLHIAKEFMEMIT